MRPARIASDSVSTNISHDAHRIDLFKQFSNVPQNILRDALWSRLLLNDAITFLRRALEVPTEQLGKITSLERALEVTSGPPRVVTSLNKSHY
jgi:hypothetical protein